MIDNNKDIDTIELLEYWRMSRAYFAVNDYYHRKIWTAERYSNLSFTVNATTAYKALDAILRNECGYE